MSENSWKTPGAVIGVIGAIVAIAGLYFNYLNNKNEKQKIINEETRDLQAHNAAEEVRQKKIHRIDELKDQLNQIESNIQGCKENIGRATMGASVATDCMFSSDKTEDEKKGCQSDLEYAKKLSETNTKAWEDFEKKENEINKQINDLQKNL